MRDSSSEYVFVVFNISRLLHSGWAFSGIWTGDALDLPKCVDLFSVLWRCAKKQKWEINRTSPPATRNTTSDNAHVAKSIIRRTAKTGNQSHSFLMNSQNIFSHRYCHLSTFHNGELILHFVRFARRKLRQRSHNQTDIYCGIKNGEPVSC